MEICVYIVPPLLSVDARQLLSLHGSMVAFRSIRCRDLLPCHQRRCGLKVLRHPRALPFLSRVPAHSIARKWVGEGQ
jgi:hypothetical protein